MTHPTLSSLDQAAQYLPADEHIDHIADRVSFHLTEYIRASSSAGPMQRFVGAATWEYEPQAYQKTIQEPIEDMLARASKKWRPVFAILLLEALERDPTCYERLITLILELIHTGALIIDDIEDESELRRGDQCIHRRYGTDIALNAANFLYFAPLSEIQDQPYLDNDQKLRIHGLITHFFLRGHLGQATDIWRSRFPHGALNSAVSYELLDGRILQTYADKTASAVIAAVDLIAVVARLDDLERLHGLREFARSVGVAFQIIDDIRNFSDDGAGTKTVGEDLVSGKLTYVLCQALRELPADRAERLRDLLIDGRSLDAAQLADGISLVRDSGVLERSRERADEIFDRGWQEFCRHVPDSAARTSIYRLCERITTSPNSV